MNKLRSIINYFSAEVIVQVSGIITLPIFVKYLTPEDYGILSLVQIFSSFFVIIIGLQLNTGLGRIYFDYNTEERKSYYSTILFSIISLTVFFSLLLYVCLDSVLPIIFTNASTDYYSFFHLVTISFVFEQVSIASIGLLKVEKKSASLFKVSTVATIISLIFKYKLIVIDNLGVQGGVLAIVFTSIFKSIFLLYFTKKFFKFDFNLEMLKNTLPYTLPIIFHALGGYLFRFSDRVILEKYIPLAMIGLYSIADRLAAVMKFLINGINDTLSPEYIKSSKQNFSDTILRYKDILTIWCVFVCMAFLIINFLIKTYIKLFMPENFQNVLVFIPFILGAYFFRGLYCFFMYPIIFEKRVGWIPTVTILSGVLNITINILFIPRYGVIVAALSTLAAFLCTAILSYSIAKKLNIVEVNFAALVETLIVGSISIFVFEYLGDTKLYFLLAFKIMLIIIIGLYFYVRDYDGLIRPLVRNFIVNIK